MKIQPQLEKHLFQSQYSQLKYIEEYLQPILNDFINLTVNVLKKCMKTANKQLQDTLMNYFLENHVSNIIIKYTQCISKRQLRCQIEQNIPKNQKTKYISLLNAYEDQIKLYNQEQNYKELLLSLIQGEITSENNIEMWKTLVRKRILCVLLYVHWIFLDQREVFKDFFSIWKVVYREFPLPQKQKRSMFYQVNPILEKKGNNICRLKSIYSNKYILPNSQPLFASNDNYSENSQNKKIQQIKIEGQLQEYSTKDEMQNQKELKEEKEVNSTSESEDQPNQQHFQKILKMEAKREQTKFEKRKSKSLDQTKIEEEEELEQNKSNKILQKQKVRLKKKQIAGQQLNKYYSQKNINIKEEKINTNGQNQCDNLKGRKSLQQYQQQQYQYQVQQQLPINTLFQQQQQLAFQPIYTTSFPLYYDIQQSEQIASDNFQWFQQENSKLQQLSSQQQQNYQQLNEQALAQNNQFNPFVSLDTIKINNIHSADKLFQRSFSDQCVQTKQYQENMNKNQQKDASLQQDHIVDVSENKYNSKSNDAIKIGNNNQNKSSFYYNSQQFINPAVQNYQNIYPNLVQFYYQPIFSNAINSCTSIKELGVFQLQQHFEKIQINQEDNKTIN